MRCLLCYTTAYCIKLLKNSSLKEAFTPALRYLQAVVLYANQLIRRFSISTGFRSALCSGDDVRACSCNSTRLYSVAGGGKTVAQPCASGPTHAAHTLRTEKTAIRTKLLQEL